MSDIQKGDHVAWNWGSSHAEGTVSEKSTEKLTIESKGKQVTRNGTEDNPAFKIENPGKLPSGSVTCASMVTVRASEHIADHQPLQGYPLHSRVCVPCRYITLLVLHMSLICISFMLAN